MIRLPILMYHKVGAADHFLNVPTRSFVRQMRLLKRLGYSGVTFEQGVAGLAGSHGLPRKPICVTFDDGYENVAEHAAPVLRELGWPATVFLPTAYADDANRWDEANGKPVLPIMSWDRLRELQAAGWEIAGHTRTHPRLADLPGDVALEEMRGGREEIEQALGCAVRTFCYPFGSVGARTPALAREAGFVAACTTRSGVATPHTDPMLLPRVKIAYRDGVAGFLYRLLIRPMLG